MADVIFKLDTDEAKAVNGFLRLIDTQKKAERGQERINRNAKGTRGLFGELQRSVQGAFGPGALKSIANFAVGFIGVDSAIQGVIRSFQKAREVRDAAGRRITDTADGTQRLRQVSGGSQKEFDRLIGQVDRLRGQKGLTELEAQNLVFSAKSAGSQFATTGALNEFADLRRLGFDPAVGVEAVQKLQANFGGAGAGKTGAGSTRQILNKVLTAAADSPVLGTDIARVAAIPATSFRQIGGQDESLLALVAKLTETFKTPEQAAEKVKSISDQLIKKRKNIDLAGSGFEDAQGLDLILALPELAKQGRLKSEGGKVLDAQKFLGESQAIQGLQAITDRKGDIFAARDKIAAAEAATGTGDDLFARQLAVGNDRIRAVELKRQQEQAAQTLQEQTLGAANLRGDAAQAAIDRKIRETFGSGFLGQFAALSVDAAGSAGRTVLGDDSGLTLPGAPGVSSTDVQKAVAGFVSGSQAIERGAATRATNSQIE